MPNVALWLCPESRLRSAAAPLAVNISGSGKPSVCWSFLRCKKGNLVAERMFKQPVYRFSSQGGSGRFGTEPSLSDIKDDLSALTHYNPFPHRLLGESSLGLGQRCIRRGQKEFIYPF
ncbi:hypothetical protein HY772_09240 [Candidatus Woesearchaeota archaeon]|nr:hypothetical protein [Candidatus Woesearchaeota archaeon]